VEHHLINAPASPDSSIVLIAKGFAVLSPWLVIGVLVLYWLLGTAEIRQSQMVAGIALLMGLAVNFTLGALFYVPRPFELGIGTNFLALAMDSSFPSDHATFLWALGLSLSMNRPLRGVGMAIVALGLATAWGRVYLGVHFPLDMLAPLLIPVLAAGLAQVPAGKLDRCFYLPVEHLNSKLLNPLMRLRYKTH